MSCDRIEFWFFDGGDSAFRTVREDEFRQFLPIWETWRKRHARI